MDLDNENLRDLISRLCKPLDQELNRKSRNNLEDSNLRNSDLRTELSDLEVKGKKEYFLFRKEWNFHIKWLFWIFITLLILSTIYIFIFRLHHYLPHTMYLAGGMLTAVLILLKFLFPNNSNYH